MPAKNQPRGWIETGKPTPDEVRAWRDRHAKAIYSHLRRATRHASRLKELLVKVQGGGEQYQIALAGPVPKGDELTRAYELSLRRAAHLEREVELLYLLLEARSLGLIRGGRLKLGTIVSRPARVQLEKLDAVRTDRRALDAELDRVMRVRAGVRPRRAAPVDPASLVPGRPAPPAAGPRASRRE